MKNPDLWFEKYGKHDHHPARTLHWICIPLSVIGAVGLLWALPVPEAFRVISPALNWGTAFLMAATVYYFVLSFSLALGLLPFVVAVAGAVTWLDALAWPLWSSSAALIVLASAGLQLGAMLAGERPALLRDVHFLMIAPAWLLARLYRRAGIPY